MKKVTSVIIMLAMILTLSVPAFAATTYIVDEKQDSVYWIDDETRFKNVFSNAKELSTQSSQKLYLCTPENNAQNRESNFKYAEYSFSIGDNAEITVTGYMKDEKVTEQLTILSGILKGTTTINNNTYHVNAVVQKEYGSEGRINAGITMAPINAIDLTDFIFFAIGDPIVTTNMLPSWIGSGSSNISSDEQTSQTSSGSTRGYTYKGSDTAGFSSGYNISGNAQKLDLYYDSAINRTCVGVKSYTNTITNYFSVGGIADTIVSDLEIGMKGRSANVPYIVNVHEIPASSDEGSDFIDTDYISYLTDLLSDVFDIAGSYFAPFELLMNALSRNHRLDVSVFTSGTDTSVTFEYSTSIFYMEDVKFDNAPMCVTFNLNSASTAYGWFNAYSNISYYTIYIPTYSEFPVYLSIDGYEAETSEYYLRVL